jgi:hypothetical protein
LEFFSHSQPAPRRELRIIISSTVRIIIDTLPTTIIDIFLVNTITMRASMFMATTPSTIVRKVLRGIRTRFRRVLCSSRLMKDRLPFGMRT